MMCRVLSVPWNEDTIPFFARAFSICYTIIARNFPCLGREERMSIAENKYIVKVLSVLKEKQELAIKEFNRTDLNTPDQRDNVQQWFGEIQKMVRKIPPTHCVRHLHIYEDVNGKVLRIEYEYSNVEMYDRDVTICIHTEL